MFQVYQMTSGHFFRFAAANLEDVKARLGGMNGGETVAIMIDGFPYQLWEAIPAGLKGDLDATPEELSEEEKYFSHLDTVAGYQGEFWMTSHSISQEVTRFRVATFAGQLGHVYVGFGASTPKEVEVDGARYRIDSVCGARHVFSLDVDAPFGGWLGDFGSSSDSDGWFQIIHSVRGKTIWEDKISPEIEFFPTVPNYKNGNWRGGVKYAESEKGAVRLIVKLVAELEQVK